MTRGRALALFAVAVVVGHHVGTIFGPLGEVAADTRWADWIDLLVPLAVLVPAAGALAVGGGTRGEWALLGVGAVLYAQGHGLHLAANSVGNAVGGDVAHFWDETVSHYPWYGGLVLVVVALARSAQRGDLRVAGGGWVLAVLFGATWATNSIEGGTPVFGLVVAAALAVWGWRLRAGATGRLLLAAYGVAFVLLAGWGVWHGGFPQFTELGWI